jgi:hypothetical protein
MSRGDAAMRLRYVTGMRTRARRAVLLPSPTIFTAMGALVGTHGLLIAIWPHRTASTIGWLVGAFVARALLLRQWRRMDRGRLRAATRLWLPCVAIGVLGLPLALTVGVDPLVTSIAATLAARAVLVGMRVVGVATIATATVGGAIVLQGGSAATGELLLAIVLIAAGVVYTAPEERDA